MTVYWGPPKQLRAPTADPDDPFRCGCTVTRCQNRMTAEDLLCDQCRPASHAHMFVGSVGADPADRDEWVHVGVAGEGALP